MDAARVPGPQGLPVVGSVFQFRHDPIQFLMSLMADYGNFVSYRMGPQVIYLVTHPDDIRHVLSDNYKNYGRQTIVWDAMRLFLGNGLLTNEGDSWLRQRRIAQPAFSRDRIRNFVPGFVEAARESCERLRSAESSGRPTDVAAEMMRATLRIVGEALMSINPTQHADAIGKALPTALLYPQLRMRQIVPIPPWLPTPTNRAFEAAKTTLDDVVFGIIRDRRRSGESKDDLLSMLMLATDEDTGERMSDQQLRDEVMTIFLAGHETTGSGLAWTFYLLSKNPEIRRQVREEVALVLGDRDPTAADIPKLELTRAVFEESMRLYPPAWITGRSIEKDDRSGGFDVKRGDYVVVSPYVTHRHPDFWKNPEGFDPGRFSKAEASQRPKYCYLPFAGGPRQCIGMGFAMMEAVVLLAMIVREFDLDLLPAFVPVPAAAVTLRPKNGVWVHAHRAETKSTN